MEKELLTKREKPGEFSIQKEEPLLPKLTTKMSGTWERKVWGRTRCLSRYPQMSIHELVLEHPGSFCSIHYHERRHNHFYILSGSISVAVREGGRDVIYTMSPGTSLMVPAGLLHQFQVLAKSLVIEMYTPENGCEVEVNDIVRQHEGGLIGVPLTNGSLFLVSKKD